jgi:hypothetical protein
MFVQRPGNAAKRHYRYYVCASRAQDRSCAQPYIPAARLEGVVISKIQELAARPERIRPFLNREIQRRRAERQDLARRAEALDHEIATLDRRQREMVDWLAETLPGKVAARRLNEKIETLEKERKALAEKRAALRGRLAATDLDGVSAESMAGHLARFGDYYDRFNAGQRKELVEAVVQAVTVEGSGERAALRRASALRPQLAHRVRFRRLPVRRHVPYKPITFHAKNGVRRDHRSGTPHALEGARVDDEAFAVDHDDGLDGIPVGEVQRPPRLVDYDLVFIDRRVGRIRGRRAHVPGTREVGEGDPLDRGRVRRFVGSFFRRLLRAPQKEQGDEDKRKAFHDPKHSGLSGVVGLVVVRYSSLHQEWSDVNEGWMELTAGAVSRPLGCATPWSASGRCWRCVCGLA